jgi:hypothetical protein
MGQIGWPQNPQATMSELVMGRGANVFAVRHGTERAGLEIAN